MQTNKLRGRFFTSSKKVFQINLNLPVIILALSLLPISVIQAAAQTPGSLDLTFGNGGKVITPVGTPISINRFAVAYATAVQADGKILVAGEARNFGYDFALVRYNTNGTLDASFDGDGIVTTDFTPDYVPFGNASDAAYAIAIQPDGKILLAGTSSVLLNPSGFSNFSLARYNTDGSLDLSFAGDGKVMTDFGPNEGAEVVTIQPDGKIVVVGQVGGFIPNAGIGIARYNTDGSPDTSFDGDGKLLTPSSSARSLRAFAVTIQPDGKIIAAGYSFESGTSKFALFRYNTNGSLDASFDGDGIVITQIAENGVAYAVGIQPDGKIVAAGAAGSAQTSGFALVRYNSDGSLDTSFDGDGKVITDFGINTGVGAIAIQSNGKIVAASDSALARYNSDGSLDVSFDGDGKVVFQVLDSNTFVNAVAIQSDGKIITVGRANTIVNGFTDVDFAVARYIVGRVIQRQTMFDFDGDGKADISVYRPSAGAWYISNSSNNAFSGIQFGISTDKLAPIDYDGDGRTDISVFRDGFWYRLNSSDNQFVGIKWGQTGDIPVPADYDGDSKADLAVFRAGYWYILQSSTNQFRAVQFGISTDKPVSADFDGDSKTDVAVFRDGNWYWLQSTDDQFRGVQFGLAGDIPVVGDYDGDSKADQAVFRNGVWYLNRSALGFAGVQFGISSDIPTPADYDGDGKTDISVFRDGNWYRLNSSNNQFFGVQFGVSTDKAVPSAFVP